MKQQEVSKKLYLDCKAEDKNDLESNDHSNYDIQHHIIGKLKKIYEQIQTKVCLPFEVLFAFRNIYISFQFRPKMICHTSIPKLVVVKCVTWSFQWSYVEYLNDVKSR